MQEGLTNKQRFKRFGKQEILKVLDKAPEHLKQTIQYMIKSKSMSSSDVFLCLDILNS